MIDANFILSKLPAYIGKSEVITSNQTVADIKRAILKSFELDKKQYASIAPYFVGNTVKDTCLNVWNFLRDNVINITEGIEVQSVKSPAAIIATGKTTGSDCKNYALFTAGILDAINRSGLQKIPIAFRFAKYQQFDGSYLDHVFVVVYPKRKNEIWIDCIKDVPYFDYRRLPDFYTDKIINSMALVRVAGLPKPSAAQIISGLIMERNKRVASGQIKPNSPQYNRYNKALKAMGVFDPSQLIAPAYNAQLFQAEQQAASSPSNFLSSFMNGGTVSSLVSGGGGNSFDFSSGLALAANAAVPGSGALVGPILNLFDSIFGNKPSPNDWVGWDAQTTTKGQSAAWWTITDGDNAKNEMVNVLSYIKNSPNGLQNTFTAAYQVFNLTPQQFAAKLVEKLNRTGFREEAQMFQQQVNAATQSTNSVNNQAPKQGAANTDTKQSGNTSNLLLYAGGALLAAKVLKLI